MSLYLIILIIVIGGPLALSFEKNLMLYKRWKYLFPAIFSSMLIFGIWDIIFTHIGCWQFNPAYNSGIYFFKLPLEEYLFFISIPYACTFSYYAIKFHFPNFIVGVKSTKIIASILFLGSLLLAFSNMEKTYTFVNFTVLAITVLLTYKYTRSVLQRYLAIFPILLLPFFIVNGILTGYGIDQEVFSYDEKYIIGIYLITMPLEDMFYAFSLLISVIAFTELFENKFDNSIKKVKNSNLLS